MRVAHRQVFVQIFGHKPGVQLFQLRGHGGGQRGLFFALEAAQPVPQGLSRGGRVAEQHLPGRREVDLLQRVAPALGEQVEGVDGVDLVPPEFQTGGGVPVRRIQVQNAAAHAELAGAFHPVAPDIARAEQPDGQLLLGNLHAGLQREGVGAELGLGYGELQQPLGGHAHRVHPAAHQPAQHGQPAVFVFPARALNGAQQQVPRGEHRRRKPQRLQIGRGTAGLGLTGGYHAQGAAQSAAELHGQRHAPGGRQAEQRRDPGAGQPLLQPGEFRRGGKQGGKGIGQNRHGSMLLSWCGERRGARGIETFRQSSSSQWLYLFCASASLPAISRRQAASASG